MKNFIFSLLATVTVLFFSCQKQLDPLDLPQNPPADTIPSFVVTGTWWYYYDTTGAFVEDSQHVSFSYDTTALTTTVTDENWFWSGDFTFKHVFYYDKAGNWLKDAELDPVSGALKYTNVFSRNAAGDVTKFDYTSDLTIPQSYSAIFQYNTVSGNREVTIVDTANAYNTAWWIGYYKVELDNTGKLVKRTSMPWRQYQNSFADSYYYAADGEITKVISAAKYSLPTIYSSELVTEYVQDPLANSVLSDFTKNLKGKNFWWYNRDRDYMYNLLFDYNYVGKPLKSVKVTSNAYQNGTLTNTHIDNYTFNNQFDQDKNLTSTLVYRNGKKNYMYKFFYKKTK